MGDQYQQYLHIGPADGVPYFTARQFDEASSPGRRVHRCAERYLGVAMDNHRALLALLENYGATHSAPWTLIRTTFENAFWACWVLDPPHFRARRLRGLRCDVEDAGQHRAYLKALSEAPEARSLGGAHLAESKARTDRSLKADADELRASWKSASERPRLFAEIGDLRFASRAEPLGAATLKAKWNLLSGYQHGLAWAMLHWSDATVETEVPGGKVMNSSLSDDRFVLAEKTTIWLLLEAISRFFELHTEPAV